MTGPTVGFVDVDRVTMPRILFATFRVLRVSAFGIVGSTATVRLRWGFDDADADLASIGITFAPLLVGLSGLNQTEFRSQGVGLGAALPDLAGGALLALPPHLTVGAFVPVAGSWTIELACAGLAVGPPLGRAVVGRTPTPATPALSTRPRWVSPYRRRLRARLRRLLLPGSPRRGLGRTIVR